MSRTISVFTFFIYLFSTSLIFPQKKTITQDSVYYLKVGEQLEREMRNDEIQKYSIALKPDQFMFAVLEQKGIDVLVKVVDPDGKIVEEIDAPTGTSGAEYITLETKSAGEYFIEVHPFDDKVESGHYSLVLEKIEKVASDPAGKVDQLFTVWDRIDSPGAAVAVVKNGEIIFKRGYGSANLEYDIPITSSTIFHMASVSKQFTAFSIALLANEGKLALDDDIRKYLPEVPDFGKNITIRHLIHHTSGLRDQWNLLVMAGWRMDDVITKEHILKLISKQKELNFDPGEEFLYCNTGYTLLAEIVSRVSGKTFAEWTKENLFDPLDMNSTLFFDDHEKIVKNRAYSYIAGSNGNFKKSVLSYANVGATSLFTTVEDLSKWALNFENPIVGNSAVIKQMEERGILNNGDTLDYAFGQGVGKYKGLKLIAHSGGDAGFRTYLGRLPHQKFSVMVLSNLGSFNPSRMAQKITDIYLADDIIEEVTKTEEKEEKEELLVDEAILKDYLGTYELGPGFRIVTTLEEDKLMVEATNQPKFQLFPKSEREFFLKVVEALIEFQRNDNGEVYQLTLHQNGQKMIAPKVEEFKSGDINLEEYIGNYYSEELGTAYSLVVKENQLIAQHRKHNDIILTPVSLDNFQTDSWFLGSVEFIRGNNNQITGYKVSNGRVRNLKFERLN